MKIEYFRYLAEIDRCRSISSAARNLFISQTTLSSIVRSMEGELGFSIFARTPQGVVTTQRGEKLISIAQAITSRYQEALAGPESNRFSRLPVSLLLSPGFSMDLPLTLQAGVSQLDPELSLRFSEAPRQEVLEKLIKNTCKIALTHIRTNEMDTVSKLAEEHSIAVNRLAPENFYTVVSASGGEVTQLALLDDFSEVLSDRLAELLPWPCCRYTAFFQPWQVIRAVREQKMGAILPGSVVFSSGLDRAEDLTVAAAEPFRKNERFERCLLYRDPNYLTDEENWLIQTLVSQGAAWS